jgi:hypothetical protein
MERSSTKSCTWLPAPFYHAAVDSGSRRLRRDFFASQPAVYYGWENETGTLNQEVTHGGPRWPDPEPLTRPARRFKNELTPFLWHPFPEEELVMAARKVFALSNNYHNGIGLEKDADGICTAASLLWAKKCLECPTFSPNSERDLAPAYKVSGMMSVIWSCDRDPDKQVAAFDLEIVGSDTNTPTMQAVLDHVKDNAPHVAIYWLDYHTMAVRYVTEQTGGASVGAIISKFGGTTRAAAPRTRWELFDQNFGFWLADTAADLIPVHSTNYPPNIVSGKNKNALLQTRVVKLKG